jgi:peptidyl-prolyl cis-trans isomerase D
MALKVGELFGPYKDGESFKITKMVDKRPNGSVKASHILITWEGAERANPEIKRTKEEARTKAEDILKQAKAEGTVFAELARDNSDGPSAPRGGDLGYFQEGVMTPKFNDFAFGNDVGFIGMVETEFGYHIVRVDDKEDLVQLATLSREIEASEATLNSLFTDATKFEMAATSAEKSFSDLAKESEYLIRPVNKITALDENLPGLSNQRSIVQWAFNTDTKIGDIRRFGISNGYAVVQLTAKYEEGLMSVEDASASVLPKIRKEKKAAKIISQNQGKSLDEIATVNNTNVSNASALTVKTPTLPGAGREPLVVGTAFALAQGSTSDLIAGETGVFKIEVIKKEEGPKLENYSTYANALMASNGARANTSVFNALKKNSEIKDFRATFY